MPFLVAFETSAAMRKIQDSKDDKQYMYIYNQKSGIENLNILLEAIKQQKCVDLYYYDHHTGFPYLQDDFGPLGLVQKDYVWYLLGITNYRAERIWPLHLLTDIKIKDIKYRPIPGFSADKFWKANKKLWLEFLT